MKIPRWRAVAAISAILLLGALATAWLAYERDLRREHTRVASGSQVIATRCGPIEVAMAGQGPSCRRFPPGAGTR